jgi:hypothetical protein
MPIMTPCAKRVAGLFRGGAVALAGVCVLPAAASAQETVGRIEGRAFTASGQVRVERVAARNTTTLLSGSEVVVHEGYARVVLTDGSEVDVCGPAKFSVLKSGGALTLALEFGRLHTRLAPALPITVYTPLVTATPVAIGTHQRDVVVGLDAQGELCVHPLLGALRLEHQFTGEKVLAPQNAEMALALNSLDSIRPSPGSCRCEVPPDPALIGVPREVAAAQPKQPGADPAGKAPAAQPPVAAAERREPAAEPEEPRIIAVMPPLTFDAAKPTPPAPTGPEVVRLIQEVRVQPAAVFTGRVEPRPKQVAARDSRPPRAGTVGSAPAPSAASDKKPGFGAKLRNFFRRLFGGKPKD